MLTDGTHGRNTHGKGSPPKAGQSLSETVWLSSLDGRDTSWVESGQASEPPDELQRRYSGGPGGAAGPGNYLRQGACLLEGCQGDGLPAPLPGGSWTVRSERCGARTTWEGKRLPPLAPSTQEAGEQGGGQR